MASRPELRRAAVLVFIWLAITVFIFSRGPWPQDESYHAFADTAMLWGIPNGLNVLSNFAFLFAAVYGCWVLWTKRGVFVRYAAREEQKVLLLQRAQRGRAASVLGSVLIARGGVVWIRVLPSCPQHGHALLGSAAHDGHLHVHGLHSLR